MGQTCLALGTVAVLGSKQSRCCWPARHRTQCGWQAHEPWAQGGPARHKRSLGL